MKNFLSVVGGILIAVAVVFVLVPHEKTGDPSGEASIVKGFLNGANSATSTDDWGTVTVGGATPAKVIKGTAGIFSGVIINNETAGGFTLYDGTTTNHGDYATSSVWHFNVYPNMAEGAYLPEISFRKGLIAVFNSTNIGSTTILTQ